MCQRTVFLQPCPYIKLDKVDRNNPFSTLETDQRYLTIWEAVMLAQLLNSG